MKKTLLSLLMISGLILISGCSSTQEQVVEEPKIEEETIETTDAEATEEETNPLLSLDTTSTECTQDPVTETTDSGREHTVYPIANAYEISADDYHNIAGLFTAAACGDARLNELFKSEFNDVAIFTENPNTNLIEYLDTNNFTCNDENTSDTACSRWYNEGPVSLEVMTGLRQWSEMIYGSDCTNCG